MQRHIPPDTKITKEIIMRHSYADIHAFSLPVTYILFHLIQANNASTQIFTEYIQPRLPDINLWQPCNVPLRLTSNTLSLYACRTFETRFKYKLKEQAFVAPNLPISQCR